MRIGRSPGKQPISINNKPRAMSIGGGTVSVPMSNATDSGAVAAGFGQPSLAPARPKEKAVIDLTDEDDAAAAAAAAAAAVEASARHRQTPSAAAKRSLQTPPMGPNSRSAGGSVVRVSPMNIPRANAVARQIVNGPGNLHKSGVYLGTHVPITGKTLPYFIGWDRFMIVKVIVSQYISILYEISFLRYEILSKILGSRD